MLLVHMSNSEQQGCRPGTECDCHEVGKEKVRASVTLWPEF